MSLKKQQGFTLVELLIVVVVIGILAVFVVTNFQTAQARARDAQRKNDIVQLQKGLEMYKISQVPQRYPTGGTGVLFSALMLGAGGPYMKTFPSDPLNAEEYVYSYAGTGGTSYILYACLEKFDDPQRDATKQDTCSSASYTKTQQQ